jgi:predicted nucleic acid-binding protein
MVDAILELSDWVTVPEVFTWEEHPDDNHLFNLAISANAKYLVTWESRILKFGKGMTPAAQLLRQLAPELAIVTPAELAAELKRRREPRGKIEGFGEGD